MCSEDTVDVHDIELMQYINVDCSKLKRLLQGEAHMSPHWIVGAVVFIVH